MKKTFRSTCFPISVKVFFEIHQRAKVTFLNCAFPLIKIFWVRLNYATTHHLPRPTTTHHQPKYIHHHPPLPTTSQNKSTTTNHQPPPTKIYPPPPITTHCQPRYIHQHPPPPTNSQNLFFGKPIYKNLKPLSDGN